MIFETEASIEGLRLLIFAISFQVQCSYAADAALLLEKGYRLLTEALAAPILHDEDFINKSICAMELQAVANRKHGVADDLSLPLDEPRCAITGVIHQSLERATRSDRMEL